MGTPLASEDHVLARIERFFPGQGLGPGVRLGRGDDCAVFASGAPLCVSTDFFMEDVHFRRSYFTPADIGWKALAVNLSDLAAMGAKPVGFTVGLALPPDADMELVDGLCAGMAELATEHQTSLVGGDLSRAERLHLCLTVFGETERPLLRGGAEPGDVVFLLGRAGLARTGLMALEARGRAALADFPEACAAHLRPGPRVREGMRLSALAATLELESGGPVRIGLMDLSDGLARDLPRLLGPGRGARIVLPRPHAEIVRFTGGDEAAQSPRQQLWLGGEDYALLGFCEPRFAAQVMVNAAEAAPLGKVTDDGHLACEGLESLAGFDHFSVG